MDIRIVNSFRAVMFGASESAIAVVQRAKSRPTPLASELLKLLDARLSAPSSTGRAVDIAEPAEVVP
jgi:hypothetical protein